MISREISERVSARTTILDQILRFSSDHGWRMAFRGFRATRRGECIVRIQVGSNVFMTSKMNVSKVTYRNLKPIIDKFHFGDLHTYSESIHITYIIFDMR